jgi:hypothetical protein
VKIAEIRVFRAEGGTWRGEAIHESSRAGFGYALAEAKIERRV